MTGTHAPRTRASGSSNATQPRASGRAAGRKNTRAVRGQPPSLEANITQTMLDLAGIASVSGAEAEVRAYIASRLDRLDIASNTDAAGNLIAHVAATPSRRQREPGILLNAHMDRVPPGRAHTPLLRDGILRSDGTTNLGADDSAGIAVILATVEALRERAVAHAPLLLLFTVGEEVGSTGAKAFVRTFDRIDAEVYEGFVFDNVAAPGAIVTRAANYIAVDVTLRGSGGHPGKGLAGTANAIEIFHEAGYPVGTLDDDTTRIQFGRIEGGSARNAIATELRAQGEIRTLRMGAERQALIERMSAAFIDAAQRLGGGAEVSFDPHCGAYTIDEGEPLLQAWLQAWQARGHTPEVVTTFIGSDTSALRDVARVFTISTGAMEEHTSIEWIALAPLAELAETTVTVLESYAASSSSETAHADTSAEGV